MKKNLADQIGDLLEQKKFSGYRKRKRNFPIVTENQIEKGAIIYVPIYADENFVVRGGYKSSDKWIVIIGFSENEFIAGSLLVNTKPNNFSKELGDIQFPLSDIDYCFLDYKSWLDCSEIFRIPRSNILKYGGYCGKINDRDWELIWQTIKATEFINDEDKELFGIL